MQPVGKPRELYTIYADVLEEYMLGAIKERLSEFQKLSCIVDTGDEQKNTTKKIRLTQIQEVVDTLIKVIRIADGNIEITWNI